MSYKIKLRVNSELRALKKTRGLVVNIEDKEAVGSNPRCGDVFHEALIWHVYWILFNNGWVNIEKLLDY